MWCRARTVFRIHGATAPIAVFETTPPSPQILAPLVQRLSGPNRRQALGEFEADVENSDGHGGPLSCRMPCFSAIRGPTSHL